MLILSRMNSPPRSPVNRIFQSLICLLCSVCANEARSSNTLHGADNGSFVDATYWIELRQGGEFSALASGYSMGGYESAHGEWIGFRRWYSRRYGWTNAHATWMTQITNNFGVIWGGSTGEWGEKYRIEPGIKIGFIYQLSSENKQSLFSIKASALWRGNLHESACVADYGAIGGTQEVNCRLAASALPPAATLSYLANKPPGNKIILMLHYRKKF